MPCWCCHYHTAGAGKRSQCTRLLMRNVIHIPLLNKSTHLVFVHLLPGADPTISYCYWTRKYVLFYMTNCVIFSEFIHRFSYKICMRPISSAFFNTKLGLDVSPRVNNQPLSDTTRVNLHQWLKIVPSMSSSSRFILKTSTFFHAKLTLTLFENYHLDTIIITLIFENVNLIPC